MSRFSALCFHFCQVPKKVFFFGQKLEPCGWTARPCPTWKKNQAAFSNWLVSLSPMEPATKTTRESGSPGGPKGRYGSFSRQGRFWSGFWLIAAVVWRFLAVSVLQLIKFWNPFGMRPLTSSNHICEVYESMSNWRAGKGTEVVGRTLVHQKAGASTSALEERAARRFFQFFTMVFVCICEVLLVMMYYDIRLWICGWLWWRCLWWWMVNQEGCMMMCGSVWWWVMYTDVFVMKTMKMMMNIMKIWWKRWHWYYGSIMVLFNVTNMCLHIYVYIYMLSYVVLYWCFFLNLNPLPPGDMYHTQTCHLHQRKRRWEVIFTVTLQVYCSGSSLQQISGLNPWQFSSQFCWHLEAMLGKVLSTRYLMQKTMEMWHGFKKNN